MEVLSRINLIPGVSVTKALAAAVAYAAEDVLSESATVGTVWTFNNIVPAGNILAYIVKALIISETTNITPALTLYLFSVIPTSEIDDNLPNTALLHADLDNFIGKIDFPALEDLGGDSEAIVTPSTSGNLPLAFRSADSSLAIFGILVTRDAFTQIATRDMTIELTAELA